LRNCLESLISTTNNQQSTISNEVFVVDNASTDGSVEMVKKEFPQVKLIASDKNLGFAKANNLALKQANGDDILFLNPDTVVPKETLPAMLEFMEKNKDIGIATCKVELADGSLDWDCHRGFPTPWASLTRFLGLCKLFPRSKIFNQYYLGFLPMDEIHEIDSCCGAFFLTRKKLLNEIGWWDEDYFFYGEDIDLCFRTKKAGWKVVYNPDVKIVHYKGAASGIKKTTQEVTKATKESRQKALRASVDAMRIFYDKHLKSEYPAIVDGFVYVGIWLLRQKRLRLNCLKKVKIRGSYG